MEKQYPKKESDPRYLPDTREQIAQTFAATGFKDRLAEAFRQRIAIVKGKR